MRIGKALIPILLLASIGLLRGDTTSKSASNVAFDRLKTLVGSWDGTTTTGIQHAEFQLIADGSVLMSRLSGGMPHDMWTMFHMDGRDFMLTHYCAMHNQPRMVLVPGGDAGKLTFKFKNGTNIKPGAGRMNQVVFVIDGPNHHIEEWTYLIDGKETMSRAEFRRKQ
jgi:hypothetical protein